MRNSLRGATAVTRAREGGEGLFGADLPLTVGSLGKMQGKILISRDSERCIATLILL